jgi:hypothetical protein
MSDTVSFKMDTRTMWRAIDEHHRTFRRSYEHLFMVAAKGVAAKAVRLTPPFKWQRNSGNTESDRNARQRGISSVEVGILKLFTTDASVAVKNGLAQKPTKTNIQANSAMSLMASYHQEKRNPSGRVPKSHKPTKVVTRQALKKYLSTTKKRVGYLASGWVQGAQTVQASVPSWVKKHAGPGSAVLQVTATRLYFRMTNAVGFPTKDMLMASRIPVAVRLQAAAMLRQIVFKTKRKVVL